MFKSLFFLLALISIAAAQTVAPAAPATSGSAVPIAVPVMIPVAIPVGVPVPVATPTATTAKGPKVTKKAKAPSAPKGSKLSAGNGGKGKGPSRRVR